MKMGWRFKLANFIMGDTLRNCLATYRIGIKNILAYENLNDFQESKLKYIITDIKLLMEM